MPIQYESDPSVTFQKDLLFLTITNQNDDMIRLEEGHIYFYSQDGKCIAKKVEYLTIGADETEVTVGLMTGGTYTFCVDVTDVDYDTYKLYVARWEHGSETDVNLSSIEVKVGDDIIDEDTGNKYIPITFINHGSEYIKELRYQILWKKGTEIVRVTSRQVWNIASEEEKLDTIYTPPRLYERDENADISYWLTTDADGIEIILVDADYLE